MTDLLFSAGSTAHILLVYAVVIAAGFALGRVKVFGVSLGVTLVLFVGLAAGHFGLEVDPGVRNFMRDFGLILFIFFIGLQVGPSFFSSFRSGGVLLNGLAVFAVLLSVAVTVGLWGAVAAFGGNAGLPQLLGMYYGAVTNTPGLGATQELLGMLGYEGENLAVAYACAYPLGVVGLILSCVILRKLFRINLADEDRAWEEAESDRSAAPVFFHVEAANVFLEGRTLKEIREFVNRPFVCSRRLSKEGELSAPTAETRVRIGDIYRVVSQPENREAVTAFFGKPAPENVDLSTAHSPIASRVLLVSDPRVNGLAIRDLHLSHFDGTNATRVFRAGTELYPFPSLRLMLGDRIRVVGPARALERLESRLGNKRARLDRPNFIAAFIGIALGLLLGAVPIAVPGIPVPVKLGLAGGPLIVAILLGRYGPAFGLVTYTTNSASLMLREMGMAFFLASVGLAAGGGFAESFVSGNGFLYMGLGLLVTLIPVLATGIIARKVFRLNYHSVVGLISGATTDPPTLAYAAGLSEKNSASVAYSTVYPLSMFLRILSGQAVLLAFWSML